MWEHVGGLFPTLTFRRKWKEGLAMQWTFHFLRNDGQAATERHGTSKPFMAKGVHLERWSALLLWFGSARGEERLFYIVCLWYLSGRRAAIRAHYVT